jgi:hypothetical protein
LFPMIAKVRRKLHLIIGPNFNTDHDTALLTTAQS